MALVTLGFGEIIAVVAMNLQSVTNGSLGLKGIPPHTTLLWSFALLAVTIVLVKNLRDSSYGRAFKAIREDEIAAQAVGINAFWHKMSAFVIASVFIGIGGGLYAGVMSTIDPRVFQFLLAYQIVTIVVLGGVGSLTGSVLGSVLFVSMFELLRPLDQAIAIGPLMVPGIPGMRMVVFSVLFLLVILFYRRGLMGEGEFTWQGVVAATRRLARTRRGRRVDRATVEQGPRREGQIP